MSVAAVTRQHFLDDITNNVGVTFLAQELRCASCHDHKFDPIPTRDYYRMQAVFAPTQFVDRSVELQPYENVNGMDAARQRIERLQKNGGPKSLSTIPESSRPVKQWDADSEIKGHAKSTPEGMEVPKAPRVDVHQPAPCTPPAIPSAAPPKAASHARGRERPLAFLSHQIPLPRG